MRRAFLRSHQLVLTDVLIDFAGPLWSYNMHKLWNRSIGNADQETTYQFSFVVSEGSPSLDLSGDNYLGLHKLLPKLHKLDIVAFLCRTVYVFVDTLRTDSMISVKDSCTVDVIIMSHRSCLTAIPDCCRRGCVDMAI